MPRRDRDYTAIERFGFRHLPFFQKAYRTGIYWGRECFVPGFTVNPKLAAPAKKMALKNIESGISDPALRRAVTPDFEIGCKRILISNDYYPAIDSEHVDLVTDGIAEITPAGIVTRDGTTREVDAIIVATGFYTTEQPIAQHIKGRDGRTLADAWGEEGMSAYKGTTISGFPNLFQIVGPNTGLGHSSMVFIIESQIAYILSALQKMGERDIVSVEPRPEAQQAWNKDIQRRMQRTVWNTGGCASWYLDSHGRNTTLWPRTTFKFRALLKDFDLDQYVVTARQAARAESPPPPRPRRTQHDRLTKAGLENKVVVITGAGSGIGRELALRAARQGALLAISDWDEQRLAESVDLLKAAGVRELRSDMVDVSDRAAMGEWATAVAGQFGRVNMVVNNAGVTVTGDFEEMSYEDFDWIVGVNLMGVVNGTKEFLPHLIASGDGHLVNISSLFGLVSIPGQSAYNATKYAVRGFTEALRQEMLVNGHHVAVTCVHPGGIRTGIARNGRKTPSQDAAAIDSVFQKLARMTPEKAARIILEGALSGKARVLVGADAHAVHHFAKLTGSRYQDIVARARAEDRLPPAVTATSYELSCRHQSYDVRDQDRSEGSAFPPQTTTQTRSPSTGS